MSLIYLASLLVFLLLSHLFLTKSFSYFIHRHGGKRSHAITIWSIFFLPGTILHEGSHFLAAVFSGARTGKISVLPEFLSEDDGGPVTLGFLETQQLNPIQGFFVGLAPLFIGLTSTSFLVYFLTHTINQNHIYLSLLLSYLFFVISNSMFPSWPDIKQTLSLIVIFILITLISLYFGFKLPEIQSNKQFEEYLNYANYSLVISTSLNLLIGAIFKIFSKRP